MPDIPEAGRVGVPRAVYGAHGVDGGAPGAREGALLSQVPLGAIPGDAGAQSGDLQPLGTRSLFGVSQLFLSSTYAVTI